VPGEKDSSDKAFLQEFMCCHRIPRCAQRGPSDWANQEDRWLHEVVLRIEGPAGLGEIARATCRLHDLRAWCEALAVQQQRGEDLPERLERAWRASPSLLRLQRWLGSSETSQRMRERATQALAVCPWQAQRQRALLHLLAADPVAASGADKDCFTNQLAVSACCR